MEYTFTLKYQLADDDRGDLASEAAKGQSDQRSADHKKGDRTGRRRQHLGGTQQRLGQFKTGR